MRTRPFKKLVSLPEWASSYTRQDFSSDVVAGLTVGIMLVPQSMAYAMLAGMPPIYGLYASLVPLLVYALFASSRHVTPGTVAIDSLIMVFALGAFAEPFSSAYIQLAFMFAFMVGIVHLIMAVGKLGFLVNLLSRPVIMGFIFAAATIIGCNQFSNLMGLDLPRREHFYMLIYDAGVNVFNTHLPSVLVGLIGIFGLLFFRKWKNLFPAALAVVILSIVASWGLKLEERGVQVVGSIPTGIPGFAPFTFEFGMMGELMLTAVTLALIQFTNVISLGKTFANKHNYSINPNKELFALGASNIVGSFFQSYTVSGSFSRTAVNEEAGAKSPVSNVFAALLIGLTLLFLTPVLYYLPIPILAAIIMVASFGMVKFKEMKSLFKMKKTDGYLSIITMVVTLALGLEAGILSGIMASVIAIMYRISRPNVAVLGNIPGTRSFRDIDLHDNVTQIEGVLILRVDASFSYANADFLKELILSSSRPETSTISYVIIDASSVNDLDTTAVQALFAVIDVLEKRHVELYFTGVHGSVSDVMTNSGLAERLGMNRFFLSPYRALEYIKGKGGIIRLGNGAADNKPHSISLS
ncbi:MAG: sulfate permease [Rhodothermaceae bacterium]|nr:sulfate permease [Rhodothermaceae bacterium]